MTEDQVVKASGSDTQGGDAGLFCVNVRGVSADDIDPEDD